MKPMWAHQLQVVENASKLNHYGLFLDMGVGKTRCAIEILKQKTSIEGRTLKTLILAPTVVVWNWKKEIVEYMPEMLPAHILVLNGTGLQRAKQLSNTPNYFVVVMNYEALLMDSVYNGLKLFDPDVIIADESHKLKNIKAQRTKRLLGLSAKAKYKYILSGTPVTNNEADLFAQFKFLDNGETFGQSFFQFRNHWFRDANRTIRQFSPAVSWPKWEPKTHKATQFRELVMSKAMSVKKEDCLDLPPYLQTTYEIEMSPEQLRAYKEMKDDYLTFIKSKVFTADLAVVKAMRLQQIASGFVMNAEGDVHTFQNTPRDRALLELIDSASSKAVVWCTWRANQKHLKDLFKKHKITYRELLGDSSGEQRNQALIDFADDPSIKVMLASQSAGGVGVSMVAANTAIYYSRGFSYEADAQSAARIHRGGQKHTSVSRIDLVVPNSIEVSCLESLKRKEDLKESILNGGLVV